MKRVNNYGLRRYEEGGSLMVASGSRYSNASSRCPFGYLTAGRASISQNCQMARRPMLVANYTTFEVLAGPRINLLPGRYSSVTQHKEFTNITPKCHMLGSKI